MYTHVEYEDDYTEHAERVELAWLDPQDQTGSDAELEPIARARVWRDVEWHVTAPGQSARIFDTGAEAFDYAWNLTVSDIDFRYVWLVELGEYLCSFTTWDEAIDYAANTARYLAEAA